MLKFLRNLFTKKTKEEPVEKQEEVQPSSITLTIDNNGVISCDAHFQTCIDRDKIVVQLGYLLYSLSAEKTTARLTQIVNQFGQEMNDPTLALDILKCWQYNKKNTVDDNDLYIKPTAVFGQYLQRKNEE